MGNLCAHESGTKKTRGIALGGGNDLGQFIVDFAAENEGDWVESDCHPGRPECWDLAKSAIEHAEAAGYEGIDWTPESSYEWGPNVVELDDAQPGDIVQCTSYHEESGMWRGSPNHTAIVAEAYDGEVLKVWEQFPKLGNHPMPVTLKEWHPGNCTEGSLAFYRLEGEGGSNPYGGHDDTSDHDEDDHEDTNGDDDDEYQYYDGGKYPYYWKVEDGYDPYEDGYYYYWEDPGSTGCDSPDTARWYAVGG